MHKNKNLTSADSSLEVGINFGNFARTIRVNDLMSTRSGFLCYEYE